MSTTSFARPQPRERRKSSIRDLFFFKRRPAIWGIPLDWQAPETEDEFQKLIQKEGFISPVYWPYGDISQHPIIAQDLNDLNEYLLPTFFEFSQKSKYYQNRFYLYQWVFIVGAFLTTVFGALASLYYTADPAEFPERVAVQQAFSILTATVGAITAFTTALSNRGEPQKRWGKTRRLAEELRMHYFTYLAHQPPYDKPDRVQRLRENIINIRVKEQENV